MKSLKSVLRRSGGSGNTVDALSSKRRSTADSNCCGILMDLIFLDVCDVIQIQYFVFFLQSSISIVSGRRPTRGVGRGARGGAGGGRGSPGGSGLLPAQRGPFLTLLIQLHTLPANPSELIFLEMCPQIMPRIFLIIF